MAMKYSGKYLAGFVNDQEIPSLAPQILAAHNTLHAKTGPGNDFLGWLTLPSNVDTEELSRIKAAAAKIKSDSEALIVIGIGGSYLGGRAAIELLKTPFYNNIKKDTPDIYFVGNNISPHYLQDIIDICAGRDFSVNVISKSGTTTEPAIAFRIFREMLIQKYGEAEAKKRIYATTDKARGTLKELSDKEGYESFVVPDDIGGRYSVLTAVGLLPIAVAGLDVDKMLEGAKAAELELGEPDVSKNDCYKYAAARMCLYRKGKQIEMLVSYDPSFVMFSEWFKQLYGESEGKDNKGIFPASATFSTDLHSLGQFIQDGTRNLFETLINVEKPRRDITIKELSGNFDGLNFLAGKTMSYVNEKAMQGTVLAHTDGGTPNIMLSIPEVNEYEFGYMVYFFEKACAISGYMLGVNPFDQPGVESYKKNMFALLGKSGYEELKAELESRL